MKGTRSRLFWMPRLHALVLGLSVAFGLMACVAHLKHGLDDGQVAPQQWRKSPGPGIPHDTFPKDCSPGPGSPSWPEIRKDFSFHHHMETGVRRLRAHAAAR